MAAFSKNNDSRPGLLQKLGVWLWLVGLLMCTIFLGYKIHSGLSFDTSILSLLPSSQKNPLQEHAQQLLSKRFSNRLVFLLGGEIVDDGSNTSDALLQASKSFAQGLRSSDHFDTVVDSFDDTVKDQIDFYRPYQYTILSSSTKRELESNSAEKLFEQALRQIYNPVAAIRQSSIVADPLNLFSQWLQKDASISALRADINGLFVISGGSQYRFITASFIGNAFRASEQMPALDAINIAEQNLLLAHPQWRLLRSGLLFHAASAEKQAKREISTIGVGSLVGIVLLMLIYFRSVKPLFLTLFALGSGSLFALTVSLLVFERVHIITLAFGCSLVGVAIDYALHFLVAQKVYGKSTLQKIMPGIRLALFSSILAYGAQALTPFPGLRQMALFSAAGLLGACLTVVFLFPLFSKNLGEKLSGRPGGKNSEVFAQSGSRKKKYSLINRRYAIVFFLSIIIFIGFGALRLQFDDDIRLLQSSPANLLSQERTLQSLVLSPSPSQFFTVSADTKEQLLQREESLSSELDTLVRRGAISAYQSLSQQVPSIRQQELNRQLLLEKVYTGDHLDQFFARLGAPAETVGNVRQNFQSAPVVLSLETWLAAPVSEPFSHLWLGDEYTASIISLSGISGASASAEMRALAQRNPGVRFVDQVEDITALLTRYREQIAMWICLAYFLVTVLLWHRYRFHSLSIIAAPLLASLMCFSALSMAGIAVNLFHFLAVLLVLGIGLDMGIFLQENQHQQHAQHAVSLSALTTLLAFGLLSLSDTPVLFSFGIVVLPGIALNWLIAAVFLPALLFTKHNRQRSEDGQLQS